ncbi:MAG: DMT family transporter [Beijerinckiaceae bacterium]
MSAQDGSDASRTFIAVHLAGNALTWGSSFLLIKLLSSDLDPFAIAALRAVGAALALGLALTLLGFSVLPKGREARDWLVLGTVNGWLPNILVAFALTRMDSGPAALIQATGPLMTAVLAHHFMTGERLTGQRVGGILVGLVGIALLIGPAALQGGGTLVAVLAMLLLTFGYAIGNIYGRVVPTSDPIRLAFGQQIMSAIIATTLVLAISGPSALAPAQNHWPALLVLAWFSTALPIWIFMRLLRRAGPTKASMTSYLVPAVAVLLGIVVLGEPVEWRQIMGGAIVLLGVAIVTGLIRLPQGKPT